MCIKFEWHRKRQEVSDTFVLKKLISQCLGRILDNSCEQTVFKISWETQLWIFRFRRWTDVLLGLSWLIGWPFQHLNFLSLEPAENLLCLIESSTHVSSPLSCWTATNSSQEYPDMSPLFFPSIIWILLVPWEDKRAHRDGIFRVMVHGNCVVVECTVYFSVTIIPASSRSFLNLESWTPLLTNVHVVCSEILRGPLVCAAGWWWGEASCTSVLYSGPSGAHGNI